MNQDSKNEEIMQRIRSNLSRRGRGEPLRATLFSETPYDGSRSEPKGSVEQAPVMDFPAYDFSSLNDEVDGALAGHRMVGQLNPRPPGIFNRGVQFLKRAMLRVLTFYTRPLRSFQNCTIRALQNTIVVLNIHDDELLELKRSLAQQAKTLEEAKQQNWAIARTAQAASQHSTALNEKVTSLSAGQSKLEMQLEQIKEELLRRPSAKSQTTVGEYPAKD